jgi:bifunctional NMN adenylyltransferase/nudix hydrolase
MSEKYDALVFIGRFSPFHLGHEVVINEALTKAKRVVVLVGSAYAPRNVRNPWTFEERKDMIGINFPIESGIISSYETVTRGAPRTNNLIIKPLPDYPYDDNKWMASVRSLVSSSLPWSDFPPKVGLIGHNKDDTSYYLKMFPDWDSVDVENYKGINATDVRENYFQERANDCYIDEAWNSVSPSVKDFIKNEKPLPEELVNEWILVHNYRRQFAVPTEEDIKQFLKEKGFQNFEGVKQVLQDFAGRYCTPYPPTFVTVDTVVVQSGHILLVKRKSAPGIGLWALPGGFLDKNETLLNGAIRELKEETKIKIPIPVLKGSVKDHKTFDDPHRSTRGRTLTTAYFIDLGTDTKLPKVTGADDAEKAVWVPFNEVNSQMMFEDHFHIIDYFTNIG